MGASSTPVASKNKVTIREVFLWALLFIFGSQIGFHFLMGSSHRSDQTCGTDSAFDSPLCTEVILFKKWQADALTAADPDAETLEKLLEHSDDNGPEELNGEGVGSVTSLPQDSALQNLIAAMAVERPDLAAWVSTSSAASEIRDASSEVLNAPGLLPANVNSSEFIGSNATFAGVQESGESDWGQNLVELQESLEKRMQNLRIFRKIEDPQSYPKGDTETKTLHITAWARDLQALQHQMEERAADLTKAKHARHEIMEKNEAERKERAEKRRTSHAMTINNRTQQTHVDVGLEPEVGKPLMQRIFDLGRELCSEPERRDRPSCIQFLVSSQNESSSLTNADDSRLVGKSQHTSSVLYDRPLESNYELVHSLKWPAVRDWRKSNSKLRGYFPVGVLTARHDELRFARWAGMIPKVACVSVLPSGREAKYQIKYLVNNFRLQSYEGPRQLVLVYDHNDKTAKKLVGQYADGVYIRGAAARSDGTFPSTMAYRFGAYIADADIIARWDFEAWHHPDRLAMQVRALAFKSRPVNRLSAWTVRNGTEDTRSQPDESIGEASLVGEKEWMAEHWHPLLGDETSTLTSAHLRYLVQLDMPGLIVYS